MKLSREGILLLGFLLFLVFCPPALCQMRAGAPIKAVLSVDSAGVKTTQVSPSPVPVRIGVSGVESETNASGGALAPGYVQGEISPKCQWVRFNFSCRDWEWQMRKPGTYASKAIISSLQSNGDISVGFELFEKLRCTDGSGGRLETRYAISCPPSSIDELIWIRPQELNAFHLYFDNPPSVQSKWELWQKIVVGDSAPPAEFRDRAIICINLLNNSSWIEPVELRTTAFEAGAK